MRKSRCAAGRSAPRAGSTSSRWPSEHPALIDVDHLVGELFSIVNVPSSVWVDEHGMIVRRPSPAWPAHAWGRGRAGAGRRDAAGSTQLTSFVVASRTDDIAAQSQVITASDRSSSGRGRTRRRRVPAAPAGRRTRSPGRHGRSDQSANRGVRRSNDAATASAWLGLPISSLMASCSAANPVSVSTRPDISSSRLAQRTASGL